MISKARPDRYDIYNNLPPKSLTLIAKKCKCSVVHTKRVLEGYRTDNHGIIKEAESIAAIHIWKTRFCRLKSELNEQDAVFPLVAGEVGGMRKIYISGPISGIPLKQAKLNFQSAADDITNSGDVAVNPLAKKGFNQNADWIEHMVEDINLLFKCNGILMLSNWESSKGAVIEHTIAKNLGMKILGYSDKF